MNIEEIKEGMYVKYTRGLINGYVPPRIAKITDCSDKDLIKIDNGQVILRNDILTASKNIIGLIQTGDYVNGKKVDEISLIEDTYYIKTKVSNTNNYDYLPVHLIKSIVTKEQFESMTYEVEE